MIEDDSVFDIIEDTEVKFLHGRAYQDGYVLDIVDPSEGVEGRIVLRWDAFPDGMQWLPHDLVEMFMSYALPQIAQRVEGDFVLYLDCLRLDCAAPHVYSRKMLDDAGRLDETDGDDMEIEDVP